MTKEEQKRSAEIKERIESKIEELEEYLEEFESFEIPELEQYRNDKKLKAACERYFEKIVEAIISLTLLLIKYKKLKQPEDEEHAFIILSKSGIISEEFAKRLRDAKDMRNRIVHNYVTIDDSVAYHAFSKEIVKDAEEFLGAINKIV